MRILVQPHDFALGGSQLNAVELAAAVRDRGHDVYLACRPGPITDLAASLGLELLDLPTIGRRPSPAITRALRRWASELGLDVLHGYEWPPGLETWALANSSLLAGRRRTTSKPSRVNSALWPSASPVTHSSSSSKWVVKLLRATVTAI